MSEMMTTWRPFNLLGPKMDEFFNLSFKDLFDRYPLVEEAGRWTPKVDVSETPTEYVVKAEVPGIKPQDIKVTLTGDRLTLQGEKRQEERKEEEDRRVWERSYGAFMRSFTFPTPVENDAVNAESEDGVLTIRVKRKEGAKSREIKVQAKKK